MEQFEVLNALLDRLERPARHLTLVSAEASDPAPQRENIPVDVDEFDSAVRVMPRQPISTALSEQTLANVLISLDACANHFDGQAREFARETLKQVEREVLR